MIALRWFSNCFSVVLDSKRRDKIFRCSTFNRPDPTDANSVRSSGAVVQDDFPVAVNPVADLLFATRTSESAHKSLHVEGLIMISIVATASWALFAVPPVADGFPPLAIPFRTPPFPQSTRESVRLSYEDIKNFSHLSISAAILRKQFQHRSTFFKTLLPIYWNSEWIIENILYCLKFKFYFILAAKCFLARLRDQPEKSPLINCHDAEGFLPKVTARHRGSLILSNSKRYCNPRRWEKSASLPLLAYSMRKDISLPFLRPHNYA